MKVVIDTNVPVVANGKSSQASPECIINCVKRLNVVKQRGKLVLDDNWLILQEYKNNLRSTGQPGVGDAFLKWVLTNYTNPQRCEMVRITPKDADPTDFEEFPADPALAKFDKDDRKFIAVALANPDRPPILQAVDVQWWQMRDAMNQAGVQIEFLCQSDILKILDQ
jgi:hypothetical protein